MLNMARLYVLIVLVLKLAPGYALPAVEDSSNAGGADVLLNSESTAPKGQAPVTPDASTVAPTTAAATGVPGFKIEVIVAPGKSVPRINASERRCCRFGRKAARKGYSCFVDLAIVEGRRNMPHRYKMKFVVHGPKYGISFARRLQTCAKDIKRRAIFKRCCNKDATEMDFGNRGKNEE